MVDTQLGGIVLPPDLAWLEEDSWSPAGIATSVSCRGSMLIQGGVLLSGFPMTLRSPDENRGHFTQVQVDAVKFLARTNPLTEHNFTWHNGITYKVIFNSDGKPPHEFNALFFARGQATPMVYTGTINLLITG